MELKNIFSWKASKIEAKTIQPTKQSESDIILKLIQEFKDRNRKDIQKWRATIKLAENPENPRWYLMQDMIDDLIDGHLASVIDIREKSTKNTRFYVIDKKSKAQLDEQSNLLNKKWFYDFIGYALKPISRKYVGMQFFQNGDKIKIDLIPYRNICPQLKRIYLEVGGDEFINYSTYPNVIVIEHDTPFGLINDIVPNAIWKRNLMQSSAEFSEKFGIPLVTAETSSKTDVPRIENSLANMGEKATGVFPTGTNVQVHDLPDTSNVENVFLKPSKYHDQQMSKRFLGSTTITDEGANRSQTQSHQETLDDKLAQDDKRMIMFTVNDYLFPILQSFGMPFNSETMEFQFDETESLTLTEQWKITNEALNHYELDIDEVRKTFNLPITGIRQHNQFGGFSANFR